MLGALRRFLQPLEGAAVLSEIKMVGVVDPIGEVLNQPLVEILPAEEGVAIGGFDLEYSGIELENRDVEGTTTEIVYGNLLRGSLLLLFQTIGQGCRSRLVDDPKHVEPGDPARILRRLALGIAEVGWDGDHRVGNRLSQVVLSGLLHLHQNHRRDFRRALGLAPDLDPRVAIRGGLDFESAQRFGALYFL